MARQQKVWRECIYCEGGTFSVAPKYGGDGFVRFGEIDRGARGHEVQMLQYFWSASARPCPSSASNGVFRDATRHAIRDDRQGRWPRIDGAIGSSSANHIAFFAGQTATMTMGLPALLLLAGCGGGEASAGGAMGNAAASVEAPPASAMPNPATTAAPVAAAESSSLEAFWTRFRAAALANDAAAIAAMSAPVVIQHGDLDDSPQSRLSPEQVAPVVAKILAKNDGVDPQGRTQRQLMEAGGSPPKDRSATPDHYRFGDMEFTRGAKGWQLTALYYESYE
ncbi:hypothetical protein [Sphingomonas parapaucimobilis]|uniref:hypothetical protein n=1 Tax=Sphingomonas parapaucimobilis TaxID=28213 RepID=UPI003218EE18